MADHLRATVLYGSGVVSIRDVRCRPCGADRHEEEVSLTDDIVFPRAGAFVRHDAAGEVFADPSRVLFFNGGQGYRVTHPVDGGDDCTVFTFAQGVLHDALGETDPAAVDRVGALFPRQDAANDFRGFAAMLKLRAILRDGEPFGVRIEEAALRVLAGAVDSLSRHCDRPLRRVRPATARVHRRTVFGARAFLIHSFHEPRTLSEIARAVYSSPFHLARMFARETGSPIHKYLMNLRLRAALERLADGVEDLTRLALDLGFSSHSHFTDSFQKALGMPPSDFRRGLSVARLRKMSKNLKV